MSTLSVVEKILREAAVPMSVKEIVERAGAELPTKSKTPDTVVARDLSMDIKKKGEASIFIRTSPGRYGMRAQQLAAHSAHNTNGANNGANSEPTHAVSAEGSGNGAASGNSTTSLSEKAVGENRAPTKPAAAKPATAQPAASDIVDQTA